MSQQRNQEEGAARYLLGTLSEAERDQLEEQYFSDDGEFENIEIAEDEMVDRYIRGKLSPSDLIHFEKVLASSPRLVERVKLARILTNQIESRRQASELSSKAVVNKESKKPGWWIRWFGSGLQLTPAFRATMAGAMALVVFAGTGLIVGWLNSRRASQKLVAEKARIEQRIRQLETDIANEKARTANLDETLRTKQEELNAQEELLAELRAQLDNSQRTVTASIITSIPLQPGATRSQGSKTDFVVKPNSSTVNFTLYLRTTEHDRYDVFVESPERGLVHRESRLQPRRSGAGNTIRFVVPAKRVSAGDYTVRVQAAGSNEPIDDYFFRVVSHK